MPPLSAGCLLLLVFAANRFESCRMRVTRLGIASSGSYRKNGGRRRDRHEAWDATLLDLTITLLKQLLAKTVVLKLNGGLGTGMGLLLELARHARACGRACVRAL